MLVRITLKFVEGRGDVYSGHPDLPTELCAHHYDADRVEVSVAADGTACIYVGSAYESTEHGETQIKIPNMNLAVPFQRFEGEKEITLLVN